jgi:hypothetical protein
VCENYNEVVFAVCEKFFVSLAAFLVFFLDVMTTREITRHLCFAFRLKGSCLFFIIAW